MMTHPSQTVYAAHATHRRDLEIEAANERLARQLSTSSALTVTMRNVRRRAGNVLILLGTWLLRAGDTSELAPALER
jgi:hypothetical protein